MSLRPAGRGMELTSCTSLDTSPSWIDDTQKPRGIGRCGIGAGRISASRSRDSSTAGGGGIIIAPLGADMYGAMKGVRGGVWIGLGTRGANCMSKLTIDGVCRLGLCGDSVDCRNGVVGNGTRPAAAALSKATPSSSPVPADIEDTSGSRDCCIVSMCSSDWPGTKPSCDRDNWGVGGCCPAWPVWTGMPG